MTKLGCLEVDVSVSGSRIDLNDRRPRHPIFTGIFFAGRSAWKLSADTRMPHHLARALFSCHRIRRGEKLSRLPKSQTYRIRRMRLSAFQARARSTLPTGLAVRIA
jgi:hypothetical protein